MKVSSVARCSIRKIENGLHELSLLGDNTIPTSVVNKLRNLKKNRKVREYSMLSRAMELIQDDSVRESVVNYVNDIGDEYAETELDYNQWLEIVFLGKNDGKLEAVKRYKEMTGEQLMVSKKAVEDYFLRCAHEFKKFD